MRVLVVDDEANIVDPVKRGLEVEGFTVDTAVDGPSALGLATSQHYDAIVLDIMLPGIDGVEVCSRLRAAGDRVPVLMLTAKLGAPNEIHALDSGADDFLTKPFSYEVLKARVRALVRRAGNGQPDVLRAGDLSLDCASHQVWRGTTPIALTPRQLAVLEFLLQHVGEVVSKSQILEHVWGDRFAGHPNIVEAYVGQLRRRIDEPFGRQSLQTVRLVGYRLDPDAG